MRKRKLILQQGKDKFEKELNDFCEKHEHCDVGNLQVTYDPHALVPSRDYLFSVIVTYSDVNQKSKEEN